MSEIIIYNTEDGKCKVDVRLEEDTVWLTQEQMAELFQKAKSTINEHIQNIYADGELKLENTMRKLGNSDFFTKPTNYNRANAEKEFMGLTTFSGNQPTLSETKIAKNYLSEKELRAMGQLVSGYLDFAERQAEREIPMTMADWAKRLDGILTSTGEQLLVGNGTISHTQAMEKTENEYKKYKEKTLSDVEKDYLNSIEEISVKYKK